MQRTPFVKALSITLLLSCASHVHAMSRKQVREENKKMIRSYKEVVKPAGPSNTDQFAASNSGQSSPELPAQVAELTKDAFIPEAPIASNDEISNAVEELVAAGNSNNDAHVSAPVAALVAASNNAETVMVSKRTLLGKELVALYNTDEKPLVQKPSLWGKTDATIPYKDEGRLLTGLGKNDVSYLKDVQAQQDLNRTLNHICAGIIQKVKEQSTLDQETGTRAFSVQQIETILDSQYPRAMELNKILSLCKMRIEAKQEPVLHPSENAKELAQRCFAALSQLQLERKRIREREENDRICQIKDGQRMSFQMRLTADKGSISDDEYSDEFIFEKTTDGF